MQILVELEDEARYPLEKYLFLFFYFLYLVTELSALHIIHQGLKILNGSENPDIWNRTCPKLSGSEV